MEVYWLISASSRNSESVERIGMKKIVLGLLAASLLTACNKNTLSVAVSNALSLDRAGEMVEISMSTVTDRLDLKENDRVVVLNEQGEQQPYQITYEGKLIFPVAVSAEGTATYTIEEGTPADMVVKACGQVYPKRFDDLAWENDLMGFRAYGPALQARGDRAFGYDLFTKRGTDLPVLEEMYAGETNREHHVSYHKDHGYGMDCYSVGPTLGAGLAALMEGEEIIYPWCYKECEILDNGPLRFTAKLTFHPLTVKGDTTVVETRLITLDAGSHLNKTAVSYTNLKEEMPIVAGIVLHEEEANAVTDTEGGYVAYTDPTNGPDQGEIFIGVAVPDGLKETKTVYFAKEDVRKKQNGAHGHVLAVSNYLPGEEFVYYWGFGWNRSDVPTAESWNTLMEHAVQKLRAPLTVEVK